MERMTIRAEEVRVGDRIPDGGEITRRQRYLTPFGEMIEAWTDSDSYGKPSIRAGAGASVEVER